jgi:c-di-GMP-binding flagellar brake protein YcgR
MDNALTDDEIEDRFFVLGPLAIIATLGQFIYKGIPVTVLFNNGNDFILTTLLEARRESLIFDLGGDLEANSRLLQSASCTFVTSINGIRVQFSVSGGVKEVWWGDANAFSVRLPTRLVRLQRRDAYRIVMPVVKFVAVRLQFSQDGIHRDERCPIHDLSVSGLGMTFPHRPKREPGQRIERIVFELPEHHEIACEGAVCHLTELSDGSGSHSYRMGIELRNPPRSIEITIQRYIISLEHIRRELAAESM